jgi:cytochrome c
LNPNGVTARKTVMKKPILLLLLCGGSLLAAPLQQQTIAEGFRDAMSLTVAPNGDLFVVEREGKLFRIRPDTGGVFPIGELTVSALRSTDPKSDSAVEDGLQGIALDPGFAKNRRLYLYYSHPEKLLDRLSRFELTPEGTLDLKSELVLIDVPSERHNRICHHGGSVQFGPDGLLYLSIGDNTNPFESDGSAPIDDRENRAPWDAQRSAGNTNDLRGKILRIRPTETGYDIPVGNLFPSGTAKTRPEIYAMGCRNPFRISIDPKNSTLYWGEVGPDAAKASERGPAGHDEVNQAKKAGNFGWPFLVGDNKPYAIWDFATGIPGRMTDPAAPQNAGIRNTGLTDLPPGQSAFIWYPYAESGEFPVMGKGGRNAMAGPVFYYDASRRFNLLPQSDDHSLITYDWVRGKIWKAKLGSGEKLESLEVLHEGLTHPMDLEMAADGSYWLLEYGNDWWFNKNGKIHRLIPADAPAPLTLGPITPVSNSPRTYQVEASGDFTITWWLTQGVTEAKLGSGKSITFPKGMEGQELRAVASDGKRLNGISRFSLIKDVEAPELTLKLKPNAKFYSFGDAVNFQISATPTPAAADVRVRVRYIPPTGHDAGGPQFSSEINALATASSCLACHQVDHASVGPAYLNVALKYRGQPDALSILTVKLKNGGAGVWGQVPMPPQVALKEADAEKIVRAVLGLAEGISEVKGELKSRIELASAPENAGPGGAWEFTAEAPGYTPARFRIPAK